MRRIVPCLLIALVSTGACGGSAMKATGKDASPSAGGAGGSGGGSGGTVTSTGGHTDPVFTSSAGGAVSSGGQRDTGPGGPWDNTGGAISSGGTTSTVDAATSSTSDGPPPVVTAVSSSSGYNCARISDGTIRCWGDNRYGQLGTGDSNAGPQPGTAWRITNATAVDTGAQHACAVLADGKVQCWGGADHGQLGNGITTLTYTPATIKSITNVAAVSAGEYHTCAVLADGSAQCWGWNKDGQLGSASTSTCAIPNISASATAPKFVDEPCNTTPVAVSGLANVRAVGTGYWHSCALIGDGTVSCWGGNGFGQLGNANRTMNQAPVTVPSIDTAIALAVGLAHNCVVLADGTVECWGSNDSGQLGSGVAGMAYASSTPTAVSGITNAVAISAGAVNTCAVLATGSIACWGSNDDGQLGCGYASLGAGITTPVPVSNITNATAVSVSGNHSCALLKTGTLQCWGVNAQGQLGNGGTTNSLVPVDTIGL